MRAAVVKAFSRVNFNDFGRTDKLLKQFVTHLFHRAKATVLMIGLILSPFRVARAS